ncbi:MAG: hypothetical protein JWQ04_1619 [Pedosphaera sp.]|nr:hypothetical protein [Pedosphaera sp.]
MDSKTMLIEPKVGGNAPAAAQAAPAASKFIRRLDHPYFELRTPDAQSNSYVEGNSLKMITAEQEKLQVFLADAKIVVDQATSPRKRAIQYKIEPEKYKNIRTMDAIPPSEFAAFEEAAKDFYDKASPDRKDVHPYETFLRLNFKLPDPDREPDAYLVYGEDFERRLLILWGCEKIKDTALPLARHGVVRPRKNEETVADKLRRKIIGWDQMQKDALLLLAKTREPLLRFLGEPVYDEQGVLKGVKIGEVALPAAKTRPLRYLLPPEMKQFYKACRDFYARAATAASPYEKELRKNFQLPDPDQMPEAFRVHGPVNSPRLIVLCGAKTPREQTIWLTPMPEINIPPMPPVSPEEELLGHKPVPPPTLTDKLYRKTIPFAKIFTVAGAIVATPLLLAFLAWVALDKSPPRPLREIVPGADTTSILVRFNKALDPDSIPKAAALIPKSFVLMESNAGPVTVLSATLNTAGPFKNRELKIVANAPFTDGTGYRISINGLKDRRLMHNQMTKAAPVGFVYQDDKPPVLGMPSGDGETLGHLVLPFSKFMDAASIGEVANYSIDGSNFKVTSASLDDDKKSVILNVSPDMPLKSEHTLLVRNVKDTSKLGNKLDPDPTSVDFRFVDTMPPKLRKVAAEEQNKVVLEFNEKLNPATVTNLANYSLTTQKDNAKIEVYQAQLIDPKKIAIFTAPLHKDNDYNLAVEKIGDVADPPNLMIEPARQTFKLSPDRENRFAPHIESLSHQPDRTKVIVDFGVTNRLRPDLNFARNAFSLKLLVNDREADFSSTIISVTDPAVADYPPGLERVSLLLSSPLEKGQTYRVSVKGLQDIWGHTNSVSDQALPVKGFYVDLEQRGIKFTDKSRRAIRLALNWQIDNASLVPQNFKIAGRRVLDVSRGENEYTLVLHLDGPVSADRFTISCNSLRMAGSHLESPRRDFDGPDREK